MMLFSVFDESYDLTNITVNDELINEKYILDESSVITDTLVNYAFENLHNKDSLKKIELNNFNEKLSFSIFECVKNDFLPFYYVLMRGYICKNFSEYINSDDNILDFYEKRKITYQTILYTLVNNKVIRDIHSDTWIEKFGMLNPFCVIRKKYFFDHVTCTYQSIKSDLTKNIFIVFHRKHKILRPEINLDNDKLTCDFHVLKPIENKILCNREFIQPDKKLELVYTTYNCMFNQNVIKEKYLSFNDGNLELYIKDRKLYINCDKIGDYKVYVDLTNEKK